jgi:hypothetical protein
MEHRAVKYLRYALRCWRAIDYACAMLAQVFDRFSRYFDLESLRISARNANALPLPYDSIVFTTSRHVAVLGRFMRTRVLFHAMPAELTSFFRRFVECVRRRSGGLHQFLQVDAHNAPVSRQLLRTLPAGVSAVEGERPSNAECKTPYSQELEFCTGWPYILPLEGLSVLDRKAHKRTAWSCRMVDTTGAAQSSNTLLPDPAKLSATGLQNFLTILEPTEVSVPVVVS